WEYLRLGEYFIAEQRLSIIRHVESSAEPRPLVIAKPRTVLFAYSNPKSRYYDGDTHQKRIVTAIQELDVIVDPALTCTHDELERLLCNREGQVFHYLGHGEEGGSRAAASLTLHGDGGKEVQACSAETLAKWVRDRPRDLVVLGSCFGGAVPKGGLLLSVGGRIVHASATPVVAMQMEVPQEFSTAFAARFYRELKRVDHDIEVAVFMARRAECHERHMFGIPVLLSDARNLPALGALQRPIGEPERWASFAVEASLPADEARSLWRASAAVSPAASRAVDRALEINARAGHATGYPPPPADSSALEEGLAELERSLAEPAAREVLRGLEPAVPAAAMEPVALARGRVVPVNDVPLSARLTSELCRAAIDRIDRNLSLPEGLAARIVGELRAGNHVMLTGPVGTGKTSLARQVTEALGYRVHLETASADWTRFEVLGGFWPTPDANADRLTFKFRAGVFLEAVQANWRPQPTVNGETPWRREPCGEEHGVWLVLDELNRADMDRALGGVFTALESFKLRVPATDADGRTVEIPIPKDFRVIATINIADRHFLFRLSDALKRRFAFVHVPVTTAWNEEWQLLCRRVCLPAGMDVSDLRRFVALVRLLHPLGTALVQAALKFYAASNFLERKPPEWPLAQAVEGAILPNLEDLRDAGLQVLCTWAETTDPGRLMGAVKDALPPDLSMIEAELHALAELPSDVSPAWLDGDDAIPDRSDGDRLAAWIARRVARPPGVVTLSRLKAAIAGLRQGATGH
ncbi:MAG TPA: AAA family ATPase, partial [Nannocystis sp.]